MCVCVYILCLHKQLILGSVEGLHARKLVKLGSVVGSAGLTQGQAVCMECALDMATTILDKSRKSENTSEILEVPGNIAREYSRGIFPKENSLGIFSRNIPRGTFPRQYGCGRKCPTLRWPKN